jgi:probable F420-dependent oxidoreductase
MSMKFGLVPINIGFSAAEPMVGLAQLAESVGIESVWTFEHVIVPLDYASRYPYAPTGKMGAAPETPFIDPLIALTAVAMGTKALRLGTGVNILPQVNPLLLAKQAASLDLVSGGRFMLGVGIGWLEEEFHAMGVPFERRGARFDDYVTAMKKVWSGEVVEHSSEFLDWHGFKSYPVPQQKPHLPVIIGGSKGKIYDRIARHGDGWFAPSTDPGELASMLAELKQTCERLERDFASIEITSMWSGREGVDSIKRLADVGVHRVVARAGGPNAAQQIEQLGNDVIARLGSA